MKRYSGKFVLRVGEDLHLRLANEARENGLSLNRFCKQLLQDGLALQKTGYVKDKKKRGITEVLAEKIPEELEGLVWFGSRARSEATAASDFDLLIVLTPGSCIDRSRYREWDEWGIPSKISPHFVTLPASVDEAHGLWLEVAVDGRIEFDRDGRVSEFLSALRSEVAQGRFRRRWSHGHPYWERQTA